MVDLLRSRGGRARTRRIRRYGGAGKRLTPPPQGGGGPDEIVEGDEARRAVAETSRRTTSRADLARTPRFDEVSPEVGELDEEALGDLLEDDLDGALTLLAELTGATDERLRTLARQLAGRVVIALARNGAPRRSGVGRLHTRGAARAEGDLDLDASIEAVLAARVSRRPISIDDLSVRAWQRPGTSLCLLIDCSGSMLGDRLAAAAVAAASVLYRYGEDCSVVAFSNRAIVLKSQDEDRDADAVVGDLLRLRGHGVTDVGLALRTATQQLDRSRAGRRVTLLMSDCRSTTGGDPVADAARQYELSIIAPAGDTADAERLATAVGGRWTELAGPASAPSALATALLD